MSRVHLQVLKVEKTVKECLETAENLLKSSDLYKIQRRQFCETIIALFQYSSVVLGRKKIRVSRVRFGHSGRVIRVGQQFLLV